jgi:23S rRNA pseudouridine2605 synthase
MPFERIQKILAHAGFGSRRACESFITEGRVTVDGEVVNELGAKADPEKQQIAVDGKPVRYVRYVYWIVNKPKRFICTSADEFGRPSALELIPEKRRTFCVGRLDEDSEGLLLLTNDGDLANLLTHPRYGVPRTYRVKVSGAIDPRAVQQLRDGVQLAEGPTGPADVRIKRSGKDVSTIDITVRQGMNRQVRRMLAKVDLKVRQLIRIRLGPIRLMDLKPGEARQLTTSEVQILRRAGEKAARKAGPRPPVDVQRKRKAMRSKRHAAPQPGPKKGKKKGTRKAGGASKKAHRGGSRKKR